MEGGYEAAVRAYRLGLKLFGEDEKVYFNLGLCLWRLGQMDEAVQAFQSALRVDPGYGRAYYNMGMNGGKALDYIAGNFEATAERNNICISSHITDTDVTAVCFDRKVGACILNNDISPHAADCCISTAYFSDRDISSHCC